MSTTQETAQEVSKIRKARKVRATQGLMCEGVYAYVPEDFVPQELGYGVTPVVWMSARNVDKYRQIMEEEFGPMHTPRIDEDGKLVVDFDPESNYQDVRRDTEAAIDAGFLETSDEPNFDDFVNFWKNTDPITIEYNGNQIEVYTIRDLFCVEELVK